MESKERSEGKSEPLLSFFSDEGSTPKKETRSSRCRSCTWICCSSMCLLLVVSSLILVVVGYLLLTSRMTGVASAEDSREWEQRLRNSLKEIDLMEMDDSIVEGVYQLVSYDENYEAYLKSLGLPFFVVPMVLASSEILSVEDLNNQSLLFTTQTDFDERSSVIQINEEFVLPWGRNSGFMHIRCQRPRPNLLECQSEERVKQWQFEAQHLFSHEGIIQTRTSITANITTKKFYRKLGDLNVDLSALQEEIQRMRPVGALDDDSESPFSIDSYEDDDFFNADDDYDEEDDFW